jgi:hypothetical protein
MIRKSLLFGLAVLLAAGTVQVRADSDNARVIQGGGTTIVTGGTGAPGFGPVKTNFGFHWRARGGKFECLALVPSATADKPDSGNFDTNVMYVTGEITSAEIQGVRAKLAGIATVHRLGRRSPRSVYRDSRSRRTRCQDGDHRIRTSFR